MKVGNFEDLKQRMALGMSQNDSKKVVDLFDWHENDERKLEDMKGTAYLRCLQDKKFRHLCYMIETFYAVAIDYRLNITQNPGCEWQLGLYSKKKED